MSTRMRARLASDRIDADGHFSALPGFRVTLHSALGKLATAVTDGDGVFDFVSYRRDPSQLGAHRTLELVVQDRVGRVLPIASTHSVSERFQVQKIHLFSMGVDFASQLDGRHLLNDLRQEFQKHEQPLDLQEAELEVLQLHTDWRITTRSVVYAIHKADQVLDVYRVTGRIVFEDVEDEQIVQGDYIIREGDANGFLVTLGTGRARGFSSGNGVTLLIDRAAFTYAAKLMGAAREFILMSQLFFPLPVSYSPDATRETAKLIFDFHEPPPDVGHPRAAGVGDARPERLLLDAADGGADVRILLHGYKIPLFVKIIAGALLFPFAGTDGIFMAAGGLVDAVTDADEGRRYFGGAALPNIKVQAFQQPILSAGVMHAKLMVVDGRRALSLGSPFGQSYVDTHDHRIDAPIRGDSEGFPKHDAGFAVTGPAMGDLYKTLKLLWDTAAPHDQVQSWPPDRPPDVHGPAPPLPEPESHCSIQIVRTLSVKTFEDPPEGEKGILEAYLRAIAEAEDFIYLETQYFTDDQIGHALVEAMKNKPKLQVIVVLNIQPDVPFYPFKQRRLITRIREGIGQKPDGTVERGGVTIGPRQFGVFTRWTHETTDEPSSRMLPIYIHAKVGIVDDRWATVGSANLDGLSLDSCLVGDKINAFFRLFGVDQIVRDQRAIEVNAIMLNTEDHPSDVVDLLRRKLWAEHLGYSLSQDVPDVSAADLLKRPQGGWLKLWSDRAGDTLRRLSDNPSLSTTQMARVLPWPTDNTTHKTPRDHLNALGIRSHFAPGKLGRVLPLKSTRAFDFETGDWKRGSRAEMDFD